jgi:hypothetical protein
MDAFLRSLSFRCTYCTIQLSDYSQGIASHFDFSYWVAYPGATQKPSEYSWGLELPYHAVRAYLIRWEDENAFASIMQVRPDPIFGQPVNHKVAPLITAWYFSSRLRIPSYGGHSALRLSHRLTSQRGITSAFR